ncbi:MAG: DEAD/DEAH box helicase family protein [Ruminiclostridium sp.]|nr:DEAD/DEAH box helicase family protein [Ruminiclostridium sp.]
MAIREWEDDNSPEIKEFPNEEEMNHYISLIYGDDTLQLLNKHRSNVSYLYNLDIVPVLAKSTLAWDEIESLGYRFFDEEYIDKHQPSDKAVYGNGLTETKLYELIRRMRSGEDVSKEFALALYGRGERAYVRKDDNSDIAVSQRIRENHLHLSYGYFEGYSKDVPYKELFDSYLNYFRKEYEEIQISAFKEETKERFHSIDGNSAEDVEKAVKEYAESVLKENNIEANIVNIAVTGSRSRGIENESSDIDVVIEVNSELKEDALFNILHGQPFSIGGISVDINPIRAEETGTLGSYLPKAEKYLAEKEKSATYSTIEQEQSPAFFRIYQLKEGDKYHYNRFESFESNKDDHLTIDDYDLVYEGKWDDLKGTSAEERLAEIWNNLNGFQLPDNYNGHSLSMSDVIVVGNETNQTAYYVDRFGFPEMPEFLLEKEQVIKEDAMDKAMRLINEYCDKEFGEPANFSNMDRVGLAYTTDEQTELEIEVYADLESFRIVTEYDGKIVREDLFNDLEEMNAALGNLEFDELVSLDDNERNINRATYSTNIIDTSVNEADINLLRTLEPRKSILNFTDEEIEITQKWNERLTKDLWVKSPYYRAQNGDWRENEQAQVNIIRIEAHNKDFKGVRNDIKNQTIERGVFTNTDTNWEIQVSRRGLEDSVRYANSHNDSTFDLLYHLDELIENSILLDTVLSEKNNNTKAFTTAFMHKLYCPCVINNEPHLAKLSVEEYGINHDTQKRLYNIREIKTEPLKNIGFTNKSLDHSVLNGSHISISDLFAIVKSFDKDFYLNKRNKPSKDIGFTNKTLDKNSRATYSTNSSFSADENITITCEWSESNAFEDGKTYSVYEFDRIMSEADNERVAGEAKAVEKYGSRSAWYESDVQDEFSRFKGYDKVKFTVNLPNGASITERQDIGDGYGGVINYFRQIQQNNTADRLEQQRQLDIQALGVAQDEHSRNEEDDFSDIDTGKIRKSLEETPPDQSPFIQQVMRDVEEIERAAAKEQNPSSNYEQQNFESLAAAEESKSTDYHIPESFAYETGMKARFENNFAAILTLKKIESENRSATPEEQAILSKYAGWGGIRLAFEGNNSAWSDEYTRLKSLLTPEEYEAARSSVLTSFYTPPVVIDTMYKALENFGFNGGKILDPSMGTGNFYGKMPDSIRDKSKLTGVELDSISGRIAKQLYPNADISITGFEQKKIENDTFDVAIGNIPFDNYSLHDPEYNKHNFLIHDYFFAKSLDKVADGGIVAFVTSKGTLDKKSPAFREYLAGKADLIGAIRLPNSAFNEVGTEVTSDIIFLQKNSHKTLVEKPDWVYTAENAEGITINQYFVDHPEMILGKMEMKSGRFGPEETCSPLPGADLKEQLEKAVSNLKAQFAVQRRTEKQNADNGVIPAPSDVRNFTFTSINDEIFYRENDNLRRIELTPQQTERVQGLINVRETLRDLITAQTNGCSDAELEARQRELNTVYDRFVRKYGTISDKSNSKVFAEDDYYNLLKSLENINPETKEVTKAEIFFKRTIKPEIEVSRADSPEEALQISLDLKGRVDIEYMSNLTGMSKADVTSQLEQAELIYLDPMKAEIGNMDNAYEDAAEYLSGNIRDKLNEAEFAKAKFIDNPEILQKINKNIEALNGVLPERIEAGDIKAEIGVNWVDVRDYEQFIAEHSKLMSDLISRYAPLRRTINGEYKMQNKNSFNGNVGVTSVAGTSRINSLKIFENLLNKRDVVVKDLKMVNGEERYVINQKETELAQEKARQMKDAFQKWIFATPERREKYVERYNVLFNSIRGREYDGSKQSFPGMSPDIELKPHQKDAVMRAKLGGNTLLAHVVGAGKSFEMVAATMEKKRLGLINKACMVVPKHLVGQTALEWQRLYPNAHILTATEKDFTKDNRNKFIGRCVTGNYDAVIMSYEQFEKIPMSLEYRMSFLQREVDEIVAGINEAKSNRDNMTVKDLERQRKQIQKKIQKLMEGGKTKDTALNFEQLGFDYLVVDEAHNYKNGLVVTKMHNVSGVQCSPAQKSEDILMKTQYINEMTGYKGLLFATGTPVSNSMVEFYTMQKYLRPDLLQKSGLQTFDDWASNFGEVVSQLEMKPAGDGFRTKKRFAKFNNLPELMQQYREFADIKTADMLDLPTPKMIGGKPQTIVAKPDEFQQAYIQQLAARSERIHNGSVDPSEDNMLRVTHEARLLGLDSRAINPEADDRPDSKVNLCIDNIMRIYNETSEQKGVQVVFCDIAVHADEEAGKWSVYDNIKQELIKRGMPESEICFAGDAKNQTERNEMYSQLRSGTKRLVIASTQKMGTGANIQDRLAALHHLDIPWKPSDLEQQNGRILRRGNQFEEVGIYHYVTEGTFDAYMLSIITAKQRFISQTMTGKTPARTCSDVDEMVLNYSEMQAIASGDPRIKEKIELDGDVAKLKMLEAEHYNNLYKLQDMIPKYEMNISVDEELLKITKADLAQKQANAAKMPKDEFAGMVINGVKFDERVKTGAALRPIVQKAFIDGETQMIGSYGGFKIGIEKLKYVDPAPRFFLQSETGQKYFSSDAELASDTGNVQRIENVFKTAIEKRIEQTEARLTETRNNLEEARNADKTPFARAAELAEKSARLEQLNLELNVDKPDDVIAADDEDLDSEEKAPEIEEHRNKPRR